MIGRLHRARTLALFRGVTHLRVRVETDLGFFAHLVTWVLLENLWWTRKGKRKWDFDRLVLRLTGLKPCDLGRFVTSEAGKMRPRRIELLDGEDR